MPGVDRKTVINWPTKEQILQFAAQKKINRRNVKICSNCGVLTVKQSKCEHCKKGHSNIAWIKEWNAKPVPRFYGNGPYYYGLELEVIDIKRRNKPNSNSGDERHKHFLAATMSKLHRREFYSKHDGSVELEIVSHPMTYKYIFDNWDKTIGEMCRRFVKAGCRSWKPYARDNETAEGYCGAHIHVSRTIGVMAVYKITSIFLDKYNMQFLVAISGRASFENRYSNFKKMYEYYKHNTTLMIDWVKNGNTHDIRYMPINLESKHTLEFRLFRGTLNQDRLKFYFEFIQSLIDWVNTIPISKIKSKNVVDYINYIIKNKNKYRIVDFFLMYDSKINKTIKDHYNVRYSPEQENTTNKRPALQLLDQ